MAKVSRKNPIGLPKALFVYKQKDKDNEYVVCNDIANNVEIPNDDKYIGIYRLERVLHTSAKTSIKEWRWKNGKLNCIILS